MVTPLITNDAVVFGILISILAFIFYTSGSRSMFWRKFYKIVPSVLLCYFIPSILTSLGVYSPDHSKLYFVASRYFLPASLVLLTLSIDFKEIVNLGPKSIIMFLSGTLGVVIGGPIALLVVSAIAPGVIEGAGSSEIWKGMATLAGSWIGGGANQVAMKEVFLVKDQLFSAMITVDVIVANFWMAFLLYGAGKHELIDRKMGADVKAIDHLVHKMTELEKRTSRIPSSRDLIILIGVAFAVTGGAHFFADIIAPMIKTNIPFLAKFSLTSKFFWLIVLATTAGIGLSFTKAKKLEGVGASKVGSILLYILVATIGMKMNILAIFDNPGLFLLGFIWIFIHIVILLVVAKLIKAPFLYVAVGSQANIGGAASAPIVASAVNPKLAPVGVLLAVLAI